jgi:hypothetical protein
MIPANGEGSVMPKFDVRWSMISSDIQIDAMDAEEAERIFRRLVPKPLFDPAVVVRPAAEPAPQARIGEQLAYMQRMNDHLRERHLEVSGLTAAQDDERINRLALRDSIQRARKYSAGMTVKEFLARVEEIVSELESDEPDVVTG